jgi:predicted ester cyclase
MSSDESKNIIRRFVVEAFERFNAAAMPELVTPDFRTDAFAGFGVPDGPAGIQQAVAILGAAFSNARVEIDDLIAEGDRVVMRYRWAADHTGPIMGIAATSKRVQMPGILIARIVDGKLAEYWRQEDMLGLLRQLGAFPPAAA